MKNFLGAPFRTINKKLGLIRQIATGCPKPLGTPFHLVLPSYRVQKAQIFTSQCPYRYREPCDA